MNKTKLISLTASLVLATAFTISCSSDPSDGGGNVVYGPDLNYDGQTYKTVVIGDQTWMAKNLSYDAEGSKCYGEGGTVDGDVCRVYGDDGDCEKSYEKTLSDNEVQAYCEKYGRLYNWQTAINACPDGWHLPSKADWEKLYRFVDGASSPGEPYASRTAGSSLKATSGWLRGNGTDKYGFNALPGGSGSYDFGHYSGAGHYSSWWTASEYGSDNAYFSSIENGPETYYFNGDKSNLSSVRCVKD